MSEEKIPRKTFSSDARKYKTAEMMGEWARGWEENITDEGDAEIWLRGFQRRLEELGIEIKKSKVLEIGSGNSIFLGYLQKQGIDAVGVDARPRGKTEGLPVVAGRIEQLPFPNESFDIILSNAVFDAGVYNQDHQLMMGEMARVLKHGGVYAGALNRIKELNENLTLVPSPKDKLIKIFRKS